MPEQPEMQRFHQRCSVYFGAHPTGSDPRQLIEMIQGEDLDTALFGIGLMHMWIGDQETIRVFQARRAQCSWGWIGERLGRTRQALWERYHDRTEETPED